MCVQYICGDDDHVGRGRYHEYIGDVQYSGVSSINQRILSTAPPHE